MRGLSTAMGKPEAVLAIFSYLPDDLLANAEAEPGEETKEEHVSWKTFMRAWNAFNRVEDISESEMDIDTEEGERRARWMRNYSETLEECWENTLEVLTGDWPLEFTGKFPRLNKFARCADDMGLLLPVEHPKAYDYHRIRRVYIPQLVRRLHKALFLSRKLFPK